MKRQFKKTYTRSKKLVRKLNKTLTYNELQKCDRFCNSYVVELDRRGKEGYIKYNIPYRPPTNEENEFAFNTCKKTFCNTECKGFDFYGNKQKQMEFKNKIKKAFRRAIPIRKCLHSNVKELHLDVWM